jgi:hypothetical protein
MPIFLNEGVLGFWGFGVMDRHFILVVRELSASDPLISQL